MVHFDDYVKRALEIAEGGEEANMLKELSEVERSVPTRTV